MNCDGTPLANREAAFVDSTDDVPGPIQGTSGGIVRPERVWTNGEGKATVAFTATDPCQPYGDGVSYQESGNQALQGYLRRMRYEVTGSFRSAYKPPQQYTSVSFTADRDDLDEAYLAQKPTSLFSDILFYPGKWVMVGFHRPPANVTRLGVFTSKEDKKHTLHQTGTRIFMTVRKVESPLVPLASPSGAT